ncbi:hypothetical protein ACIPQ3_07580 [Streptomyces albidoflavus]
MRRRSRRARVLAATGLRRAGVPDAYAAELITHYGARRDEPDLSSA